MFDASPLCLSILGALLLIYLLGGFIKGAAAFGQPMVTIPLSSLLLPVRTAIAISIAPVVAGNIVQLVQNRRALGAARAYLIFYVSLAIAMTIGLLVLSGAGDRRLLVLIGGLILLFVAIQLTHWRPRVACPMRPAIQCLSGGLSGLLGGMTSFVGFPSIPLFVACELPREQFAVVICVMFLLASLLLSTGLSVIGVYAPPTVLAALICMLPSAAGQMLGQRVRDRLPERRLQRMVFGMLGAMGVSLILRGLL